MTEGDDGTGVSVSFANPVEPSFGDLAAGFTYDFFFGNDSSLNIQNVSTPSVNVPSAALNADGTLQVRGVIRDRDGATSEYQTLVTILEDEPAIQLVAKPTTVSEGEVVELLASVVDQGNEALEQIVVDWGDGTIETFDSLSQTMNHIYADNGTPIIELSLWSDGREYTQTVGVTVTNSVPEISSLTTQSGTILES